MSKTNIVLGKREVTLRFDFNAADKLAGLGLNIYDPNSYNVVNPGHIASLVWAGQLHERHPMTRDQVVKALPVSADEIFVYAEAVVAALEEALGVSKDRSST